MANRPGIVTDHRQPADGGVSPNQYADVISVQVRCHWPPRATVEEVRQAMADGYAKALVEMEARRG